MRESSPRPVKWLSLVWLFALLGCRYESRSGATRDGSAPAASIATVPAVVAAPSASPLIVDPDERAARATLEAWQMAQNERDFTAYSALYADSFVGLKRVGERSFRFNRQGWLIDRRGMFDAGARVEVSDVRVTRSGSRWLVTFEQSFTSPSYRDRGRKLLALVPVAGNWRIAREEMGPVQVDGGGGSAREVPGFFAMNPLGVVLRSRVEDAWLSRERLELSLRVRSSPSEDGPPPDFDDEGPLVLGDVSLPPEVRAMKGKRVFVTVLPERPSQPLPPPCESRVVDIRLASSVTPAFESTRRARQLDHVYGTYVLGVLDPPCPRGVWAAESVPSAQYLPEPLGPTGVLEALRAFRASPEYAALQVVFTKAGGLGKWHEREPAVLSFGPAQGTRLVHVSAYRHGTPDLDGNSLSLLFEQKRGVRALTRLGVVDRDGYVLTPRLAFDLEGDGELELLTAPSGEDDAIDVVKIERKRDARRGSPFSLRRTTVFSSPDFVCPG